MNGEGETHAGTATAEPVTDAIHRLADPGRPH